VTVFRTFATLGLGLSGLGGAFGLYVALEFGYEFENSDLDRDQWLLLLLVLGAGSLGAFVAAYGLTALSHRMALVGALVQAGAAASLGIVGAVTSGGSDDGLAVVLTLVFFLDLAVVAWARLRSPAPRIR
jgi:hypothetical protein